MAKKTPTIVGTATRKAEKVCEGFAVRNVAEILRGIEIHNPTPSSVMPTYTDLLDRAGGDHNRVYSVLFELFLTAYAWRHEESEIMRALERLAANLQKHLEYHSERLDRLEDGRSTSVDEVARARRALA